MKTLGHFRQVPIVTVLLLRALRKEEQVAEELNEMRFAIYYA